MKVRLTRSPMRLFELGAAAPLLVLRPGPLLQAVSRDLELHLQVGQGGKGALQLRQELIRIERGIARFRASTAAFRRIKIEHLHFSWASVGCLQRASPVPSSGARTLIRISVASDAAMLLQACGLGIGQEVLKRSIG